MKTRRKLLAGATVGILGLMLVASMFALPVLRGYAATTWLLLSATPSATPPPLTIGGTPEPSGILHLPENAGQGSLIFVYTGNLYRAGFDGEPATLLAQQVDARYVVVSPDGRSVIYERRFADKVAVHLVRLDDLNDIEITLTVAHPFGYFWSADGEWLAIDFFYFETGTSNSGRNETLVISRNRPVPAYVFGNANLVTWLTDGRLLVEQVLEDNPRTVEYAIFDPQTAGDLTPLPMSGEQLEIMADVAGVLRRNYLAATALLNEFGLEPAWSLDAVFPPVAPDLSATYNLGRSESACGSWSVGREVEGSETYETIAEFTEGYTRLLPNYRFAADGSLWFVGWSSDACTGEDIDYPLLTAHLYRLVLGETPVRISEPLVNFPELHAYDFGLDGELVVWAGYDVDNQTAYLATTNYVTGETRVLISVPALTMPLPEIEALYPTIGFTGVWWVK